MNALQTIPLLLVTTLTGCATLYDDAMRAYDAAEQTTFVRRTLEWTAEPGAPARDAGAVTLPAAIASPDAAVDVERDVAAAVGGPAFADRVVQLRDGGADVDALLGAPLAWRDLAPAVALRNPAVQAARENWRATLLQYPQTQYLQALVDQYAALTRYLDAPGGGAMSDAFFPMPGAIAYGGEMARADARLARIEWERTLRDTLIEAGELYFDYQYLVRADATTRENIDLLGGMLSVTEERYRAGSTGQADLLRLQTALERQRNMLLDLQAGRAAVIARLNALLDRPAEAPLGQPAPDDLPLPDVDAPALRAAALAGRQELLALRTRIDVALLAIRMGEVMNRPSAAGGERPDFARSEAYLAEMRGRLEARRRELRALESATAASALAWLQGLDVARRRVRLIGELVLPQNRSAHKAQHRSYAAGSSAFADLFDTEREWIDARLEHDEARRDLNRIILRVGAITGRVPVEQGIQPQMNAET